MALKLGQCNCGSGRLATELRPWTVYVQGKPETRDIAMCKHCADSFDAEQRAKTPYTREYHVANVNRLASRIRAVVSDWFEEDGSDMKQTRRISGEMLVVSRSLSAELAAISAIDHHEYNKTLL